MSSNDSDFAALRWVGDVDGYLELLDQTALATEVKQVVCRDTPTLFEAIRSLRVRGAPAIGVAAAYGVCLGVQGTNDLNEADFFARLDETCRYLATSRPTAVNLFWALDRMRQSAELQRGLVPHELLQSMLLDEARRIHEEDAAMCRAIGAHGAALLNDGDGVLTHCNAGALATSEYGTALACSMPHKSKESGSRLFVDETRPLLRELG